MRYRASISVDGVVEPPIGATSPASTTRGVPESTEPSLVLLLRGARLRASRRIGLARAFGEGS